MKKFIFTPMRGVALVLLIFITGVSCSSGFNAFMMAVVD